MGSWILAISFFLTACKKDATICKTYTELTDHNHLVDITVLNQATEFNDTLTKYPQLQVYKVIDDQYLVGMHCNVFYNGLKVFTDVYTLYKNKSDNRIYSLNDFILNNVNFSLTPSLKLDNAISIARQTMNYNETCIFYRLGIYDLNAGTSYATKNYKLVWKIQGNNGYPYVVLDANNGQVYSKDDGIRF